MIGNLNRRHFLVVFLMLISIMIALMVLSGLQKATTADTGAPEVEGPGHTMQLPKREEASRLITLGLLSPALGEDGEPDEAAMRSRYKEIYSRFYSDSPVIEQVEEARVGERGLIRFWGPMVLVFTKDTGRVWSIFDGIASEGSNERLGNPIALKKLPIDEARPLNDVFRDIIESKLNIVLDDTLDAPDVDHLIWEKGVSTYGVRWHMTYYGYKHIDDALNASFEKSGEEFILIHLGYGGTGICPDEPVINMSQEEAEEIALKAVTEYYDMIRRDNPEFDFIGSRIIGSKISYLYRNDLLKSPDMITKWVDIYERQDTHLCYIVEVIGAPPSLPGRTNFGPQKIEVYVDTKDGTVVGGKIW